MIQLPHYQYSRHCHDEYKQRMSSTNTASNMITDILHIGNWAMEDHANSIIYTDTHDLDDTMLQPHPDIGTIESYTTATVLEKYLPTANQTPENGTSHDTAKKKRCDRELKKGVPYSSSIRATVDTPATMGNSRLSNATTKSPSPKGGEESGVQPRDGG